MRRESFADELTWNDRETKHCDGQRACSVLRWPRMDQGDLLGNVIKKRRKKMRKHKKRKLLRRARHKRKR